MIFYRFTHAERDARRAEIIAYAQSGEHTFVDIAEKFNISPNYARVVCASAGIKCKRIRGSGVNTPQIYDWSKAPWGKPDAKIAAAVGCSHQAVAQKRKRLGIPQGKAERMKQPALILAMLNAGYSMRDIRIKAGVSNNPIKARAKEAGIVLKKDPPLNKLKVDWSLINWGLSDSAIARQLNCHYQTVFRYRKRLGIPAASG